MKRGDSIVLIAIVAASAFSLPAQNSIAGAANPSVEMDDARIVLLGQIDTAAAKHPRLGYPGTGMLLRLKGDSVSLKLSSNTDTSALTVVTDHGEPKLKLLRKGEQTLVLASGLDAGPHIVEVYKRTETWQGIVTLIGIELPAGGNLLAPVQLPIRKLLFVGDSVTCGAGVDNNPTCSEDPLIQSAMHIAATAWSWGGDLMRRRTLCVTAAEAWIVTTGVSEPTMEC